MNDDVVRTVLFRGMAAALPFIAIASTGPLLTGECRAQGCVLLVRESFRLGDRPHGNGNVRFADMGDHLSGFWPQQPSNGVQWITSGGAAANSWRFAIASEDPTELDPLDIDNGVGYGDPGAAALVPFSMPTTPVTISVNVTGPTSVGFTSSSAVTSNFAANGALWIEFAFTQSIDEWTIRANGGSVVLTGSLPGAFGAGVIESGYYNIQLTYDPVNHIVSGQIQNAAIPPTFVDVTTPIAYVGIEAPAGHPNGVAANNFSVFTGPRTSATAPATAQVCAGGEVMLSAIVTDTSAPFAARWHKDSVDGPLMLYNGGQLDGSVLAGVNGTDLLISNATPGSAGSYRLFVGGACGMSFGSATVVTVTCDPTCDSIDFNDDSLFPDTMDIDDFLTVFSGGPCSNDPNCGDIDFNNDGLFPDTLDIDSLLGVFSGGECM